MASRQPAAQLRATSFRRSFFRQSRILHRHSGPLGKAKRMGAKRPEEVVSELSGDWLGIRFECALALAASSVSQLVSEAYEEIYVDGQEIPLDIRFQKSRNSRLNTVKPRVPFA